METKNKITSGGSMKFNEISENDYDIIDIQHIEDETGVIHSISVASSGSADKFDNGNILLNIENKYIEPVHDFIIQNMGISNAHKVKKFTEESSEIKCPATPRAMSYEEVKFIIKMVLSEMTEMAQTVCESPQEALQLIQDCIGTDVNMNYKKPTTILEIIAEQVDAGIDAEYYLKNAFAKMGVNADRVFNVVHLANMNKKWEDGKFHRREDGKVIKNPKWTPPDINKEIKYQMEHGAW